MPLSRIKPGEWLPVLPRAPMPHFQELHVFVVVKFISTFATTQHLFGKWRKSLILPLHQVGFSRSVCSGRRKCVHIFWLLQCFRNVWNLSLWACELKGEHFLSFAAVCIPLLQLALGKSKTHVLLRVLLWPWDSRNTGKRVGGRGPWWKRLRVPKGPAPVRLPRPCHKGSVGPRWVKLGDRWAFTALMFKDAWMLRNHSFLKQKWKLYLSLSCEGGFKVMFLKERTHLL